MLEIDQIQSFYPPEIRPFRNNILREYLQYRILESIFRSAAGTGLSFMGGTCIHLVHGSPRFSEDLDFDNQGLDEEGFEELAQIVVKDLEREGYTVELETTFKSAYRASFRFPSILFESGLSGHRNQKLLIRVDAEPQHFQYERTGFILNKFDVFARIYTVPADVLLAQKILCIFSRPRPMGRDLYDASFLLGKTQVNMTYLEQRLGIGNRDELRERLLARCGELDLPRLAVDVEPFITKPQDIERMRLFPDYIRTVFV